MSELLDEQNVDTSVDDQAGVGAVTEEGSPESSGAAEGSPESSAVAAPTPDFYSTPEFQQAVAEHASSVAAQQQQQFLAQLADALGGQQPQGPPPPPDPWDDNYAEKMAERDQWFMDSFNQQLQQQLAPFQQQQTEQQVDNAVSSAIGQHGLKPEDAETVNRFGAAFFTDAQGDVNRAAQLGAQYLKSLRQTWGEQAVNAYKESLKTNLEQPSDPGVSGAGMQATPAAKSYDEILARHEARQPNAVEAYRT